MGGLPVGTVTFLFTDVEGSTRLLQELGVEAYTVALAEHRRVLREACTRHGGVEVDTQGDSLFVAFSTAPGALAAARHAQAALRLPVRMGLHTGTPLLAAEGYVGMDVHRAARIAAAGHGGQVLVSASTAALADGIELRDLGKHRFKDLTAAERVYQLGRDEHPPLRTLYRTNLPVTATPFVGRVRELAEVGELLERGGLRLLTLSGPGGTGKTRLALQAVAEAADEYPDGRWWVGLAGLRDPSLVLPTVARVLGVEDDPRRSVGATLAEGLVGRRALLLIDNAEHLLPDVAADIAQLRDIDDLRVVVTSRERLQLHGEHVYDVPSLAGEDAASLFLARAASVGSRLERSDALRELCRRLDQLPLALELAAGRTRLLSIEQLLERLGERLDLFRGGRDADPRQQTLRTTIEWSYDLLTAREQSVFRAVSVFGGGCVYEAAEAVCGADVETLQSLIDKSLVLRRDTGVRPRFWMLETIRQFAAGQLIECGEAAQVQDRHLAYYLSLGERAHDAHEAGTYWGADRHWWQDWFESEIENFRLALDWAISQRQRALALRLAGVAVPVHFGGTIGEGRGALERARALSGSAPADVEARAAALAGHLALEARDHAAAVMNFEASLALYRSLANELKVADLLSDLAEAVYSSGDISRARQLYEEAIEIARRQSRRDRLANALHGLGEMERDEGHHRRARELLEESLRLAIADEDFRYATFVRHGLADLALEEGNLNDAERYYRETLTAYLSYQEPRSMAYNVAGLAATAAAASNARRAGRLWGAVVAFEERRGTPLRPSERTRYERYLAGLDSDVFARNVELGRTMSTEQAVRYALATD